MMSLFTAAVCPGQALGFFVLDATLYEILSRIKADPQLFPKLDLTFDHDSPVTTPIIVHLPSNGLRLRFDGAQQRLRLIEVVDFGLSRIIYKDRDVYKPAAAEGTMDGMSATPVGPGFRHIYNRLFGPTFPGEYMGPSDEQSVGTYVLSYPGIAFSFPVDESAWSTTEDSMSLLSSPSSRPATSMALFNGDSWQGARQTLFEQRMLTAKDGLARQKGDGCSSDSIDRVRIHGAGSLELTRTAEPSSLWIQLGTTTVQTLVAELGPPDAIYRKHEHAMAIHKDGVQQRRHQEGDPHATEVKSSQGHRRSSASSIEDALDEWDRDLSSRTAMDDECFYNYFHLGFDVLISRGTKPSALPPSRSDRTPEDRGKVDAGVDDAQMVATKVILHGNVPGSYAFHRHARCQWELAYMAPSGEASLTSETSFKDIFPRLQAEWKDQMDPSKAQQQARGMALNRDWEQSMSSSCELLGGWEGNPGVRPVANGNGGAPSGKTTLFGFPGLVFEALHNDSVSSLTVY